jgi:transposase
MADVDLGAKGAHTENCMSAGSDRIELIPRGERRRSWTTDQKREIAVESLAPGTVTAAIARRHGIGTGLLYTWRKQLLSGELGEVTHLVPSFFRVDVAEAAKQKPCGVRGSILGEPCLPSSAPPALTTSPRPEGLIEIMLAGGVSVRVDAQVDGAALRRVLLALEGK